MQNQFQRRQFSRLLFIKLVLFSFIFTFIYSIPHFFFLFLSLVYTPAKKISEKYVCAGVKRLIKFCFNFSENFNVKIPKIIDRKIVLISNHRSHLDVFTFLAQIPRLRVVANKKLYQIPFLGLVMKYFKHIPFDKNDWNSFRTGIKQIKEGMLKKDHILIFPELTRCEIGTNGTNKFVLFPFTLAIQEKAIIIPLVVIDSDLVWPRGKLAINFKQSCKVFSLDPVDSTSFKTANDLKRHVQNKINSALIETTKK